VNRFGLAMVTTLAVCILGGAARASVTVFRADFESAIQSIFPSGTVEHAGRLADGFSAGNFAKGAGIVSMRVENLVASDLFLSEEASNPARTLADAVARQSYFEFTFTAAAPVDFTGLAFTFRGYGTSATGYITVRSSADDFTADLATVSGAMVSANRIPVVIDLASEPDFIAREQVTFRFYIYNEDNRTGNFRIGIDNVEVSVASEGEQPLLREQVFMAYVEPWTDPSVDMAVTWVSDSEAVNRFEYRPAGTSAAWQSADSRRLRPYPGLNGRRVHTARLTGLDPDTVYEMRWPGTFFTETFKTTPAAGVKVAFLSDYQNTDFGPGSALDQFGAVLSGRGAHFAVLVGDYVDCNGAINRTTATRWHRFIAGMARHHRTPDGALVPMVALTGNHEGRSATSSASAMQNGNGRIGMIAALFSWSYDPEHPARHANSVATLSVGSELLLVALNTDHTEPLAGQMDWLAAQLAGKAAQHRHVVVAGHGHAFMPQTVGNWTAHTYARILRQQAWPVMAPHAGRIRFYICGHIHTLMITDKLRMDIDPALTEEQNDRRWVTDRVRGIRQIGAGPWGGSPGQVNPDYAGQASVIDGSPKFIAARARLQGTQEIVTFGSGIADTGNDIRHIWLAEFDALGFSARVLNNAGQELYQIAESRAADNFGEWVTRHFSAPEIEQGLAAEETDADGDGSTNYDEYVAGTDPRDRGSFFRGGISPSTGAGISLSWSPSIAGRQYRVYMTQDLQQPFQPHAGPFAGPVSDCVLPLPEGEPRAFFRIGVELPAAQP
jgi:hypothetical protein